MDTSASGPVHAAGPAGPGPALAIDIGGTKLAAGIVAGDGSVLRSATCPTAGGGSAEDLFSSLVDLVGSLGSTRSAATVCGVGCGGPMAPHGETVSPLNIPAWREFPLRARLAERFGLPTFVDNDAKAFALAEGWLGAAAGERNFIGMVVSTGVGGGIVLDGRLLDGGFGNAGHIGHVIVNPGGRRHAGIAGSLEGEASGTAIAALTGGSPAVAGAVWRRRTGRLVGRAVGGVANLLDLRLAVVGGSVALGYGAEFYSAAQGEVDEVARLSFSTGARVVPPALGASAPLVGAAAVGFRWTGHRLGCVEPPPRPG